jgi:protein SCO1/2
VYGPIVGGAVHVLGGFEEQETIEMTHTVRVLQGGVPAVAAPGAVPARAATAGAAAMGGPFSGLVRAGGPGGSDTPFSSDDLVGRGWHLLYFGFTHCPDVCPDELEKVAAAVDMLAAGDQSEGRPGARPPLALTPVFISLDPARDTPSQVGAYVREFHESMVGVTGPPDAVAAAARAYRVYHARAPTGPGEGDYLIDHSIITYLVAPDGRFVTFFGKQVGAGDMAAAVWERAAEWEAGGVKQAGPAGGEAAQAA